MLPALLRHALTDAVRATDAPMTPSPVTVANTGNPATHSWMNQGDIVTDEAEYYDVVKHSDSSVLFSSLDLEVCIAFITGFYASSAEDADLRIIDDEGKEVDYNKVGNMANNVLVRDENNRSLRSPTRFVISESDNVRKVEIEFGTSEEADDAIEKARSLGILDYVRENPVKVIFFAIGGYLLYRLVKFLFSSSKESYEEDEMLTESQITTIFSSRALKASSDTKKVSVEIRSDEDLNKAIDTYNELLSTDYKIGTWEIIEADGIDRFVFSIV